MSIVIMNPRQPEYFLKPGAYFVPEFQTITPGTVRFECADFIGKGIKGLGGDEDGCDFIDDLSEEEIANGC